jgi:hypothetical protein
MKSERLADVMKQIPEESSIVHVAWVRRNEDGFLNSGGNTSIFEEPLEEGHVDRLSSHLRMYSLTLRQQIGMMPGTTLVTDTAPPPTVEGTLAALKELIDQGKLKRVDVANYLNDKEQEEFEGGRAEDT